MVPGAVGELIRLAKIRLETADELQFRGRDRGLNLLRRRPFRFQLLDDRVDLLLECSQGVAGSRRQEHAEFAGVF